MSKTVITLVTHEKYIDVCSNFIELFQHNWQDCVYDFWILVIGQNNVFNFKNVICFDEKKTYSLIGKFSSCNTSIIF